MALQRQKYDIFGVYSNPRITDKQKWKPNRKSYKYHTQPCSSRHPEIRHKYSSFVSVPELADGAHFAIIPLTGCNTLIVRIPDQFPCSVCVYTLC